MTEDAHAQANAEQVQVLLEALGGVEAGVESEQNMAAEEVWGLDPAASEVAPPTT